MIIYFFILLNLNTLNPPPPPRPHPRINDVCSGRMTWGSKLQYWFLGEGVGVYRGRDTYIYYAKKGHFIEVSPHVSSLIVANGDVGWFSSPYFLVVF